MRIHRNELENANSTQRILSSPLLAGLLAASLLVLMPGMANAHGNAVTPHRAPALEVRGELPAPPAGVAILKFGEFFQMPVGPLGLEPSEKLLALNGKRIRLVGYMVREENPVRPLPVLAAAGQSG